MIVMKNNAVRGGSALRRCVGCRMGGGILLWCRLCMGMSCCHSSSFGWDDEGDGIVILSYSHNSRMLCVPIFTILMLTATRHNKHGRAIILKRRNQY